MIYRKLFDWIDSDDACEATTLTLYSGHDPANASAQDYIISRVKNLIKTGVTVLSISLTVYSPGDEEYQVEVLSDFADVIKNIYSNGDSIETMVIKVSIKEHHWA